MIKYFNTLANERGDVLPNYRAQVVDGTGATVTIYRDKAGTRFTDASGNIVNYATASSNGRVSFYWEPAVGQTLQTLDVAGDLVDAEADFGDSYVLDVLPGEIAQSAVTDLTADLAAKAAAADLASTDAGKGTALIFDAAREYLLDNYYNADTMAGDWALALASAIVAADGKPIRMTRGATYAFATTCAPDSDFVLDMNGATIVAPTTGAIIASTASEATLSAGAYFTTVAGATTFTIPGALSVAEGDWLKLESNTVRVANGTYYHGEWVEITAVSGSTATISRPFLYSYQVDTIRKRKHKRQEVFGGTIDATATVAQTAGANPPTIVDLYARDVRVDVRIVGNQYVGQGVKAEGINVDIGGYAEGITNIQGLNNGSGGRTGYGFSASGRFVRFFGTAKDCKHGFASAERTSVVERVLFDGVKGSTPSGAYASMDTSGENSPLYQGILDCHANVYEAVVRNVELAGCNSMIMMRCGNVRIDGADLTSLGATALFGQDGVIYLSEENSQNIIVRSVKASASETVTGSATPALFNLYTQFGNQHIAIDADGLELSNLQLAKQITPSSGPLTVTLGRIRFANVSGELIAGARLGGEASGEVIGAIESVELNGDFSIASANYSEGPAFTLQNFTSVGRVTISGSIDARGYAGVYAVQIGRSSIGLSSAIGSATLSEINISANIKAYQIGVDIATTGPAPGQISFAGARIEYNSSNAIADAHGVRTQFSTAPSKPTVYPAAVIKNLGSGGGLGGGSTQAIKITSQASNDLSGLQVNDTLTVENFTEMPNGLRLSGFAENVIRNGSPAVYYHKTGVFTADSVPTFTDGSSPPAYKGMTVYNRTPTVGQPKGWVFVAGSGWQSLGNL